MSKEQQSDLGAYNLRSKKKLIDSPAVIEVSESELTGAKDRPVEEKVSSLLPTTSGQQKIEVKLEGRDKKIGPSLLSVTDDREKESQAVGAEIKSYTPSINLGQRQVPKIETIKAEQGEITGLNTNLPSAYKVFPSAPVKINEPGDEPPTGRLTPTAPLLGSDSDTDVDVDSESDEEDS